MLWLAKGLPYRSALLRIVPLAGLNSCVLGTVLVERTQSFTLGQSLGFGLGSGLGYVLAVLLVTEAVNGYQNEDDDKGRNEHKISLLRFRLQPNRSLMRQP